MAEPALPGGPNGICLHCGGDLLGDGYLTVLHCENAEDISEMEPDGAPVFCAPAEKPNDHD